MLYTVQYHARSWARCQSLDYWPVINEVFLSNAGRSSIPVFMKLSSSELHVSAGGYQWFQETKMHNGGRILLAVINLYVRIEIRRRYSTLIVHRWQHTDNQSLLQSISFLILQSNPVSTAGHRQSMLQAKRSGYRIFWGFLGRGGFKWSQLYAHYFLEHLFQLLYTLQATMFPLSGELAVWVAFWSADQKATHTRVSHR